MPRIKKPGCKPSRPFRAGKKKKKEKVSPHNLSLRALPVADVGVYNKRQANWSCVKAGRAEIMTKCASNALLCAAKVKPSPACLQPGPDESRNFWASLTPLPLSIHTVCATWCYSYMPML